MPPEHDSGQRPRYSLDSRRPRPQVPANLVAAKTAGVVARLLALEASQGLCACYRITRRRANARRPVSAPPNNPSVPGSGAADELEVIGVEKSTVQFWQALSPWVVASIQSALPLIADSVPHGPTPFVPTLYTLPVG